MATTPNFGLSQPVVGQSPWTDDFNDNMGTIDTQMKANADASAPGAGKDTTAIHNNVAGEIAAIAAKVTAIAADRLLIEDSADTNNKKSVAISAIVKAVFPTPTTVNSMLRADGIGGNYVEDPNIRSFGNGVFELGSLLVEGSLSSQISGTVAVTQNSDAVVGTGTSFLSEVPSGSTIKIDAETFTVAAVISDVSLTLDSNFLAANQSGLDAFTDPDLFTVQTSDDNPVFNIANDGRIGMGGTTTPTTILEIKTPSTGDDALRISSSAAGNRIVSLGAIFSDHGGIRVFQNDGTTERARLSAGPNSASFVLGSLSIGINSIGSRLVVKGATVDNTASGLNITDSADNSIFFVRNDGKVGINLINPATLLDVKADSTGSNAIRVSSSVAGNKIVTLGAISNDDGGVRVFLSDGTTENARISTNGDSWVINSFGIGILSGIGSKLVIKGTTADNTASGLNVTDSINYPLLFVRNDGKIGIGTANPATSALLDLTSTTGALLLSRMTTTQRDALTAVNGMILYNTTTGAFNFREGGAWVIK